MFSKPRIASTTWLGTLIGAVVFCGAAWAGVDARVANNPVMQGETVQLLVEVDATTQGEPDFSPLERDFTIVRSSSGSQITSVGGQTTRTRTWSLLLAPKRTGNLVIQPIRVGQAASDPIAVEVLKPDTQAGQTAPAFIEFSADTTQPYVRQQVLLSVKLFVSGQLASGGLSDPAADNAVIEQLGEQQESQAVRGQTRYRVFERSYVLFAEAAGALTIDPPSFSGELRSGRSPRALFNFGGLGDTRTVVANGEPITLQVQAPPANAPADNWLPAGNVALTQSLLPADVEPQVGVPLTREIVVTVDGQLHTQIAPLALPELQGAQVYAEPPDGSSRSAPGSGVRGVQTQRWAVIPQAPGTLTLPAIELRWWDTTSDSLKTASLPASTLTVQPAAGAAPMPSPVAAADPQPALVQTDAATSAQPPVANTWWPVLAVAALAGWLLTAVAWMATRWAGNRPIRARRAHGRQQRGARKAALQAACKAGNARDARRQLLAWAALRFSAPGLTRLAELPPLLRQAGAAPELIQNTSRALQALDRAAFSGECSNEWHTICDLLPLIDALKLPEDRAQTPILPPLYPA